MYFADLLSPEHCQKVQAYVDQLIIETHKSLLFYPPRFDFTNQTDESKDTLDSRARRFHLRCYRDRVNYFEM